MRRKDKRPLPEAAFDFAVSVDNFYKQIEVVGPNTQSRLTTIAALLRKYLGDYLILDR